MASGSLSSIAAVAATAAAAAILAFRRYRKNHASHKLENAKCEEYLCMPCAIDATFQKSLTPADSVAMLKDGVRRSISGQKKAVPSQATMLSDASKGQWPYAAVLSCIDSRAPVEQIFDANIGDLFVGRVAGNVASPDLIASLEYATKYAGAKAILVMGHTKCGAVKGAWSGLQDGHLTDLLARIQPAVEVTKAKMGKEATEENIDACVRANVHETMRQLRDVSTIIAKLEVEQKIAVVGAVYNVVTGKVAFLDDWDGFGPTPQSPSTVLEVDNKLLLWRWKATLR